MKKLILFLFICVLVLGVSSTYAVQSVSDFGLKLYSNGYIPSNPTNTLAQCESSKTYHGNLNTSNSSRSACFQLDLTSKYYYFICRNTNTCDKTEILNKIGYTEKAGTVNTVYTNTSSDLIGGTCGNDLDLTKYTRLSESIKGQLIAIGDKIQKKYINEQPSVQAFELGYYDHRFTEVRSKLVGVSGKETLLEVVDMFQELMKCKIEVLNSDSSGDDVEDFMGDMFGDIDEEEDKGDDLKTYLTKKFDKITGKTLEGYTGYITNYELASDNTKSFALSLGGAATQAAATQAAAAQAAAAQTAAAQAAAAQAAAAQAAATQAAATQAAAEAAAPKNLCIVSTNGRNTVNGKPTYSGNWSSYQGTPDISKITCESKCSSKIGNLDNNSWWGYCKWGSENIKSNERPTPPSCKYSTLFGYSLKETVVGGTTYSAKFEKTISGGNLFKKYAFKCRDSGDRFDRIDNNRSLYAVCNSGYNLTDRIYCKK